MAEAARQLNREYYAAEAYPYSYPYEAPYFPDYKEPQRQSKAPAPRGAQLSARSKKNMVSLIIFLGIAFFLFIFVSAYCASIQTSINDTIAQSESVQNEIDALNVELEKSKNIAYITNRAENELGMIYPGEAQIIYVDDAATKLDAA
jgi:cell division protein FtsB